MARGDGVPGMVMSKQTPHLISQHNALSDDMTATAAHYSGQPFGLLKDVTLSALPFKAWSTFNLSRPLKNNAEDHYTDMHGHNPLSLQPDHFSTIEPHG